MIEELKRNTFNKMCQRGEIATNSDNEKWVSDLIQIGYDYCQQEYEEKLRWIPVEEKLPETSNDKNDWWKSDIGEVFPYSRKCIVVNDEGEFFINNYSIFENCWATFCGTVVKWRYL